MRRERGNTYSMALSRQVDKAMIVRALRRPTK
jgi:hypothetical protein